MRCLFALTHQFLQQLIAGDELYTRVHKKVAPDASQGWTVVLMDRATRFLWDMHCGRKDRTRFQKAMGLLCQVIEQTGDLTLLTDSVDGIISTRRSNAGGWTAIIGKEPMGTWELALPNTEEMQNRFKNEEIDDILLVLTYTGRTPAWPA